MDFQQADVKCKQFDPESFDGKMINYGWSEYFQFSVGPRLGKYILSK